MTETLVRPTAATGWRRGHPDLREWLEMADALGHLRRLNGVDWDLEIGTLTEMVSRYAKSPPVLLFDEIKGYPKGRRVVTCAVASKEMAAAAMSLDASRDINDLIQDWREKSKKMRLTPVEEVSDGPILENVLKGNDIDITSMPVPRWNVDDGGRYVGTADMIITRDPDSGHVNVGTYRMMVHEKDKIGLYISPGKDGRIHRDKHFAKGEPMPVAAVFGMDPLLHVAGSLSMPSTVCEYEWVGGVRGAPVEVINGPVTGLPIPATAEIAIEGYLYPDKLRDEGPFGEWTGYYASAIRAEPYVEVQALYHRNDPIILGYQTTRPPGETYYIREMIGNAMIWDALEVGGIQDVRGIARLPGAGAGMLVISLKQRYGGHSRHAARIAANSRAGAYLGRYVVVVDEDIDPHNVDDVLWAIWTRSDPSDSLEIMENCWSTPLDPRIPPDRRARKDFTNSRLIIDATRPFHWRDQFPKPTGAPKDFQAQMRQKWGNELFE